MKFIFDFDDVLFNNMKGLRERIYSLLLEKGISRELAEAYIERERLNQFSLKKMLKHFSLPEEVYEEVMKSNTDFLNQELVGVIKKLGKDNCYLITYGDKDFQADKIKRTGIAKLFSDIAVVSGTKKEFIESICEKHKDGKVFFIDDKDYHFKDLDFKKYSNLTTILYNERGLEKLKSILP